METASASTAGDTGAKHQSIYDLLKSTFICCYSNLVKLNDELHEMIKATYSEDLQDILIDHLKKGSNQVDRFVKVLDRFGMAPITIGGENTEQDVIAGFLTDGIKSCLQNFDEGSSRDAALIIHLKRAGNIQATAYNSLSQLCEVMGYFKISELFAASASEEKDSLDKLEGLSRQIFGDAYENTLFQEFDHEE
jgi:ferritin-like metal-binding protein YciE